MRGIKQTSKTIQEHSYQMLSILIDLAPTGADQRRLTMAYDEAVKNDGYEAAFKWAAGALSDGASFGNWPWVQS